MSKDSRGRKRGDVWSYFKDRPSSESDPYVCECAVVFFDGKVCGNPFKNKSTKNLKDHLKSMHDREWAQLKHDEVEKTVVKKRASAETETGQPLLSTFFAASSTYPNSHPAQKAAEKAIARFFASTTVSYRIVEDSRFVSMIKTIDQKIEVKI